MADGIHANYAKIGFTVAAGIAAIVAALIYLGGAGAGRKELLAEVYYNHPVSGLSAGSEVNFRGVKMGEVREVSFIGNKYPDCAEADRYKIYILLAFDERHFSGARAGGAEKELEDMIAKGIRATVTSSGITGLSRIELDVPNRDVPVSAVSWTPRHTLIPPLPSMLDSISDAAAKFFNQMNRMKFQTVWSNVTSIADSAAGFAANLDELVESQRTAVSEIVNNLNEATMSLRTLVDTVRDNPSLLLRGSEQEALPETRR